MYIYIPSPLPVNSPPLASYGLGNLLARIGLLTGGVISPSNACSPAAESCWRSAASEGEDLWAAS